MLYIGEITLLKVLRQLLQLSSIFMIGYLVVLGFSTALAVTGVISWTIVGVMALITFLGAMIWTILAGIYVPWIVLKRLDLWEHWVEIEEEAATPTVPRRRRPIRPIP